MADATLREHQHGKSRVRLGRTWRETASDDGTSSSGISSSGSSKGSGSVVVKHHFVEWSVETVLESAMAHAFESNSNAGMTATDTQKNAVYLVAKQLPAPTPPEGFALALARFFLEHYPLVSVAKVRVVSAGWSRVTVDGREHAHGFQSDEGGGSGQGRRFAEVEVARGGAGEGGEETTATASRSKVVAGVEGWRVLKTTQSGYEGFLKDRFTRLPDTRERIAATSVTASWRYGGPCDYDGNYRRALAALGEAFFGPPKGGAYSPSLQFTLFEMAKKVLEGVPSAESVHLRLPNLHFLPCAPVTSSVRNCFGVFFRSFEHFLSSSPFTFPHHFRKKQKKTLETVRRRRLRGHLGAPRHDRGDRDARGKDGAALQAVEQALRDERRKKKRNIFFSFLKQTEKNEFFFVFLTHFQMSSSVFSLSTRGLSFLFVMNRGWRGCPSKREWGGSNKEREREKEKDEKFQPQHLHLRRRFSQLFLFNSLPLSLSLSLLLSLSYLMYWLTQRNPSPYPILRTTLHMNTSIGLTPASRRSTLPLPVV